MVRASLRLAFASVLLMAGCGKGEAAATGAKSGTAVSPPPSEGVTVAPASAPGAHAAPPAAVVTGAAGAAGVTGAIGAAGAAGTGSVAAAPAVASACPHAACADHFFVDATAPVDCAAGSSCNLMVKLTALGEFHVNDEYPYRFKADEAPGVDFSGTDALGKSVFSKPAGDWHKADAKTGVMTVKFTPHEKGEKTISGSFKLSVCSAQNCLLEQRQLAAPVLAH